MLNLYGLDGVIRVKKSAFQNSEMLGGNVYFFWF